MWTDQTDIEAVRTLLSAPTLIQVGAVRWPAQARCPSPSANRIDS
jgi:hypothetical protein